MSHSPVAALVVADFVKTLTRDDSSAQRALVQMLHELLERQVQLDDEPTIAEVVFRLMPKTLRELIEVAEELNLEASRIERFYPEFDLERTVVVTVYVGFIDLAEVFLTWITGTIAHEGPAS